MKKLFFVLMAIMLVLPVSAQAVASIDKDASHYHSAWNSQSGYLNMKTGEVATIWIKFTNKGTATWFNNGANPVHLGTSNSLDRSSSFYTSSWLATNRPSTMSEAQVVPGGVGTFTFEVKAPGTTGSYREYFRPVVEGLTWMEDNGVYIDFNVSMNTLTGYTSTIDSQSEDISIAASDTETVWVKLKNTGTATWYNNGSNPVHLGTDKSQDRTSKFYNSSWLSTNRVAALKESKVMPGSFGTFEFTVKAPSTTGTYTEYFRPVAEGLTWFNDNNLFWKFTVTSDEDEGEIDLSASSNSTGVKLVWDKYNDSDIDGYKILKSTTDSSPTYPDQSYRTISEYNTTTYTDTSVSNGTKYYYRIGVYRDGEIIEYSDIISITYNEDGGDEDDNEDDLNLEVSSTSDGVKLIWDYYRDSDVDGYKILRSTTDSTPTYPDQSYTYVSGYTKETYTDTSVTDGKKYYYRIGVYQDGAVIVYSEVESVTYDENASDDDDDLNLEAESSTNGVELNWDEYNDDDIDGYKILRSTSDSTPTYPDQSYTYISGYTNNQYTDGSVTDGKKYYYRIGLYMDGEIIGYSEVVSITYNDNNDDNDGNLDLTADSTSDGVELSWDQYEDDSIDGYKVLRSTSDSSPTYPEQSYSYVTGYTNNEYVDGSVADGQKYYYRIGVYQDGEIIEYSETVMITYADDSDGDFELTAENTAYGIKLVWDEYNDSDIYYVILRSTSDSTPTYPEQIYTYITNPDDTDYYDSAVSDGQRYYYRIAIYQDDEILAYSNIVNITAS